MLRGVLLIRIVMVIVMPPDVPGARNIQACSQGDELRCDEAPFARRSADAGHGPSLHRGRTGTTAACILGLNQAPNGHACDATAPDM